MSTKETLEAKAILLGESSVGKTSILTQYSTSTFCDNPDSTLSPTLISDTLEFDNVTLKLEIWDTAGQEKFRAINKIFYKNAKIVILVYDITKKETFLQLQNYWMEQIKNFCEDKVVIGLVGNKSDLINQVQVTEDEAKKFAKENKCVFREISAKRNIGVNALFNDLGKAFINCSSEFDNDSGSKIKNIDKTNKKCCS